MGLKEEQFLNRLLEEAMGGDDKERVVDKTVPMKKEWKEIWDEMKAVRKEANLLDNKAKSMKRKFWSTIEEDIGYYDRQMTVDTETNEIIIYQNED